MNLAYVDTSAFVAIAFGERGAGALARRLEKYDGLLSSNLLEAELRAAFAREDAQGAEDLMTWITWVLPNRPLTHEIGSVLEAGYLRGADLWHVACALYVAGRPDTLTFISLDEKQQDVARILGFSS
jgi:predicted nucleic acid-binding protein